MEETFRYMAIRDPKLRRDSKAVAAASVPPAEQSAFHKHMSQLLAVGNSRNDLRAAAKAFQDEHRDLLKNPYVGTAGERLGAFVKSNVGSETKHDKDSFVAAAKAALVLDDYAGAADDGRIRSFLASDDIRKTSASIVDCVVSQSYAPTSEGRSLAELSAALKMKHLLSLAADNDWPAKDKLSFDDLASRIVVALPKEFMPARHANGDEAGSGKDTTLHLKGGGAAKTASGVDTQMEAHNQALAEVKAQTRRRALEAPKPIRRAQYMEPPSRGWLSALGLERFRNRRPDSDAQLPTVERPRRAVLSAKAYGELSASTKTILQDTFGFSETDTNPVEAVLAIEGEISRMYRQQHAVNQNTYTARVGNVVVNVTPQLGGPRVMLPAEDVIQLLFRGCAHYSGIGELRIVKQELIAYELKDIAHVENVLTGETKDRIHRRLDRTEELVREIEDVVRETAQESASTERHELETESQKEAEQQVHIDGSVTVSGSYGPTVDFSTSVSGGFSSSTSSSSRRASTFAREVTEKAVKRIKENIVTERRRTTLREIEETNKHGIINTAQGATHIRGVYRWLDKIYRARVFTYGLRHLMEFVVPEPAAFYLWSLTNNDAAIIERVVTKPTYGAEGITRANWSVEAANYNAQGVKAPPPQYQWLAHKIDVAEQTKSRHTHSAQLAIPEGYKAVGAIVNLGTTSSRQGNAGSLVTVHDQLVWIGDEDGSQWVDFGREHAGGSISVTYRDWNYYSYALGVDVLCEVTVEHEDQWRFETYNAILEAYSTAEADYQARLAALATAQGVDIQGSNPADNQRTIRQELQRICLSAFTETQLDDHNVFEPPDDWKVDFEKARTHGSLVRFFQHAFEWENMTYVFYPYFWGRFERWTQVLHTFGDPDPAMTQFLKSGAARVQVPVRPGFELAVARYCQDKTLPQDAETPVIGDDLYVPIIEEILESLDAPDGGVQVGEPWEVAVPTSLVLLEDAANLTGFRDEIFGNAGFSNVYP